MGLRAFGRTRTGRNLLARLTRGVELDSTQRLINSGDEYIWGTQGDNRVRHTHERCDGQVRRDGARFPNGLRYPRDPEGEPGEVYNCRCFIEKYRG